MGHDALLLKQRPVVPEPCAHAVKAVVVVGSEGGEGRVGSEGGEPRGWPIAAA